MIPLSEPILSELDQRYVQACVASGWVSSAGPWVERFEKALAEYAGASHAVAVSSGTAALHLSLLVAGVKADDLVLMPDLSFIAPANAVRYCGADPWLVDVHPGHWQMDLDLLRTQLPQLLEQRGNHWVEKRSGRRVAALLLVHALGYAADLPGWQALARQYGWPLIEDAAEALGSRYAGKQLGTFGQLGCLSFNGNKVMTTGGGGAVLTDDHALAQQLRHLSTQARSEAFAYRHDALGYNYRLSGLSAALGLSQLEQLPDFLAHKAQVMQRYQVALPVSFHFPSVSSTCAPNYWLCTACTPDRDGLAQALQDQAIQTRALWTPLHQQPLYQACPFLTRERVSERLFALALSLPSSANLGTAQQDLVIATLRAGSSG